MKGGSYFDQRYEQESIDSGLADQTRESGLQIPWWFFDPGSSTLGEPYDEGSYDDPDPNQGGLRWSGPHIMPALSVTRTEGVRQDPDTGFYVVDQIVLYMPYRMAVSAGMLPPPDEVSTHLQDRFLFDNRIWKVGSMISRNLHGDGGTGSRTMILVAGTQATQDELVNSVDFQQWATPVEDEPVYHAADPTPITAMVGDAVIFV